MTYYRLIPVEEKNQIQTVETKLQEFGNTAVVYDPEFGESIVLFRENDWTEKEIKGILQTESVIGAFPPDMLSELLHALTTALNVRLEDLLKEPISLGKHPSVRPKYSKGPIRPKKSSTGSLYKKRMLNSLEQHLNERMTIRKHYQEADVKKLITLLTTLSEYDPSILFDMLVDAKILIRYQLDHNTICYKLRGEGLLN